ncbi:uncharacterized protein CELE_ZK1128.3 [Caenorhabditis elegans]|uniref:Uncharacterized protein ZK1128.3 n=1 Tax=Caenorhabditis elegans TaxID=6239 RepID=YS03_CAEEL|nr:Uncharacterized protein CELE_ZK1128.3 [Caenorhabditis elegans]Q09358.1 RecName: Full=Uncharacterized protein ZK1128.3 [Caenorhabditis elegans]CAA87422.1 Uncharacterized protein CELE_ZK1128.3 [Caenorhabditis elegans]|eukprot:NP_499248.1 Uncharacterized protein CELE_ZK1128.3 [Caenorhabditis elegans]
MSVHLTEGRRIIQYTGFDDIDEEDVEPNEEAEGPGGVHKKRRGARKKNRRQRMEGLENVDQTVDLQLVTVPKVVPFRASRLLQEIYDRERVHGMRRDEARQLLEDKLLFLEEKSLENLHLRRFCLVVPSDEHFQLDDGSKIPSEIVSISMENGKISSILRVFPSKTRSFEMESVENFQSHRMRRVYWNPSIPKDSNSMFRTWNHFLDGCLLSLLLVPLNKLTQVLEFLRKINEMRTVINNRITVSICLSRVICVEDYLSAVQKVMNTRTVQLDHIPSMDLPSLHFALDFSRYHIQSMNTIFTGSTEMDKLSDENSSHELVEFSSWSCHREAHINMEPEKYHRILHWLWDLSPVNPVDEAE